jgi:hypothetical protein
MIESYDVGNGSICFKVRYLDRSSRMPGVDRIRTHRR